MQLNPVRRDTTEYRGSIAEGELEQLIKRSVCAAAGIDPSHKAVRFRCWHSSTDSSTGIKHSIEYELIIDHTKMETSNATNTSP